LHNTLHILVHPVNALPSSLDGTRALTGCFDSGRTGGKAEYSENGHSGIENHAEDIKLSTLERVANAPGKRLQIHIA
jgi:hypothetical protein